MIDLAASQRLPGGSPAVPIWLTLPLDRFEGVLQIIDRGDVTSAEPHDEIADLARSFNRMYLSLVKAIRMLESQ